MAENEKLNLLLEQELDEDSARFIESTLEEWKETIANTLMEEFEAMKAAKIEELEEDALSYRETLKAEYADKMFEALEELKESVRAEVTASVLQENPEIKILEQIKELIAPTIQEDYRSGIYEDSVSVLQQENQRLRREVELKEGAQTLAELVKPFDAPIKNLIVSLIQEGNSEEITEQFYNILESIETIFQEEDKKDEEPEDEPEEDEPEEDEDDKKSKSKKKGKKDEDEDEPEEDEDETKEESFIDDGISGLTEDQDGVNPFRDLVKSYSK
jgi:hypothetical protein